MNHLSRQELADLRHQLRTPLNHIIGYAEMLIEDLDRVEPNQAESNLLDQLRVVLDSARLILELVQKSLLPRDAVSEERDMETLRNEMSPPLHAIVRATGQLAQHADDNFVADVLRISTAAAELLAFVQGHHQRRSISIPFSAISTPSEPTKGEGHLLVVDDDEANRDILSRHLIRQGYSVVTADEGTQALDLLRKQQFDLVLLDLMMPGMNGFEVLDAIRSNPATKSTPVVMISALDEMQGIAHCIEQGAEDYLFKPFDPVLLRARLHSTLERKRLSDLERRRTEDLEQIRLQLQQANEELERFAYAASHDLQEPLRMVSSYVALLARRYQGKLDADCDDFINFAIEGTQRMSHMISDLLAYSKLGAQSLVRESLSSEALLQTALSNLTQTVKESGARVEHDELPRIVGDPSQLERLFQNLISNAIKYRSTEPPVIRIGAAEDAHGWTFHVADNGIGISPSDASRIFRPFSRLHGKEIPGTGLGLAICQRIVEGFGGKIWVESYSGTGSTFYFVVPRIEPENATAQPAASA